MKQKPEIKKQKPIFAKKSFGQNFLADQNYIDKIVRALNPQKGETIVEIGAGRGALTKKLIESGANIIALELDRDLIPHLTENFGRCENFQLIQADALKVNFSQLTKTADHKSKSKLAANLPFYISTVILQKLIVERETFSEMILMFQREVVERITAEAGTSQRGFLTVLVEAYLRTEKLFDVPPNAFRPAPKVWSAVARLIPKNENEIGIEDEKLFRQLVSAGFTQKRKTILNNLKNASANLKSKVGDNEYILNECEIETKRRAETLTLEEWKQIYRILYENKT